MGRDRTFAVANTDRACRRSVVAWVALVMVLAAPTLAETLHTCHLTDRVSRVGTVSLARAGGAAPPAMCPGCLLGKVLVSALPLAAVVLAGTVFTARLGPARTNHPVHRGVHATSSRAPPPISR